MRMYVILLFWLCRPISVYITDITCLYLSVLSIRVMLVRLTLAIKLNSLILAYLLTVWGCQKMRRRRRIWALLRVRKCRWTAPRQNRPMTWSPGTKTVASCWRISATFWRRTAPCCQFATYDRLTADVTSVRSQTDPPANWFDEKLSSLLKEVSALSSWKS